ncbi:MAG: T9SS type A sorting domain-containing protein [Bacteroidota bacterium]
MIFLNRISTLCCFLLLGLAAFAQPTNCISFDQLEIGTVFNANGELEPGATIYSQAGTDLSFTTLVNENGATFFDRASIPGFQAMGNTVPHLQLNDLNATFTLDGPAQTVTFFFAASGGFINFGINGEVFPFNIVNLQGAINDAFPGFEVEVLLPNGGFGQGTFVMITGGDIEQVTIGGTLLFVDDFCSDYFPNTDCDFLNPLIVPFCSDGAYDLSVDFGEVFIDNDFVDVFIDDELFGFYPTPAGAPIYLDSVAFYTQDSIHLTICENDNPECCFNTLVQLPDCTPTGCIDFQASQQTFVDFNTLGQPIGGLYRLENGIRFTKQTAVQNGIALSDNEDGITRFIPDIPGFTTSEGVAIRHSNATSLIDFTNYETNVFSASLDFYHLDDALDVINVQLNDGELYEITVPGQGIMMGLADGLFVQFYGNDFNHGRVTVVNADIQTLRFGGSAIAMDNVCVNQEACLDSDALILTQQLCDAGNPAEFYLDLWQGAFLSDGFELSINGEVFEQFNYDDLPLSGMPLPGEPGDTLVFTASDLLNGACVATQALIVAPCATVCDNFTAEVTAENCLGDVLLVSAMVEGSGNGHLLALEGLSNSSYIEGTVNPNGVVDFELSAFDIDEEGYVLTDQFSNCTTIVPPLETQIFDCPACDISIWSIENTCNGDGTYSAFIYLLDGNGNNPSYEFTAFVNNEFAGTFSVGQILLTDLVAGEVSSIDIAQTNGFCVISQDITAECEENCNSFDPTAVSITCLAPGFVQVVLDYGSNVAAGEEILFSFLGNTQAGFVNELGQSNSILEVGNEPFFDLIVTQGATDCFRTLEIDVLNNCNEECAAFTAEITEVDCFNNSLNAFLTVAFTGTFAQGQSMTFEHVETGYTEEMPLLGESLNLPWPRTLGGTIRVTDTSTGCVVEFDYEVPPGCAPPCADNFVITEVSCTNGLTAIAFQATGSPDQTFTVSTENLEFTLNYGDEDYVFQLPLGSNEERDIRFTDNTTGCFQDFAVQGQCFCLIENIETEIIPCNENDQWFIDLTFTAAGNWDSAQFVVTANGGGSQIVVPNGTHNPLIGPFDSDVTETVISIVNGINVITDCNVNIPINYTCEPNTGDCSFNDVFAEGYGCDDGQFLVDIQFNNPNGGDLGFYIFGDGVLFGPYEYGQDLYTFGPLDGTTEDHSILLLDIADPACFVNYPFTYTCTDECLIQEVVLSTSECDGETFTVTLEEVVGQNLGTIFALVGNGESYGTLSYDDLPIEIGTFAGDGETVYEFGVIDLLNPGCTNAGAVGPIDCSPCDLRDLTYEVACGPDGYTITFDFIFENPGNEFFGLELDGEPYDAFLYELLPITISLPAGYTPQVLSVNSTFDLDCETAVDLVIPCCDLGSATDAISVSDCTNDGLFYLEVGEIDGFNLSDQLNVSYAPAGSSIIVTETVAYAALPAQFGPLPGDGTTAYTVILSDAAQSCAVTTTLEPVFCDNGACIEFEGVEGVWGSLFGHAPGETITVENGAVISFEQNPASSCTDCNVLITDGIPNVAFGSGHIVATDNSGFGINLSGVSTAFNTVNVDYYVPNNQGVAVQVNGQPFVFADVIGNLPTNIAPGVSLQVSENGDGTGMLTFSGDNITSILLASLASAAFDNVCLTLDDNVWPGDTNSDNVAGHIDLLNVGLAFGETGPSRIEQTDAWAGLISPAWGGEFANGVNYKHADANGDGTIDLQDREVIEQNYGLAHGPVGDFEELPFTSLDPLIAIDTESIESVAAGDQFMLPIVAGEIDQEIEDIYGLAFTIQVDPEIIDMDNIEVVYPTSWFGEPEVNTTNIHRIYPDGRIEIAVTRIDGNNVSGYGTIAQLRGIIIDDIILLEDVYSGLEVKHTFAVDHLGLRKPIRPDMAEVLITHTKEVLDREHLRTSFRVYPNPTQDVLHFRNDYGLAPSRAVLYNTSGQQVTRYPTPGMRIDLSQVPAGVYWLEIHLEGFIFTEKVVKLE